MSATPTVKRKTEAEIKKIKDDERTARQNAEDARRNAEREEQEQEERWLRTPWHEQMSQNPKKFSKFDDKTKVHSEKACFKDFKDLALRLNELLIQKNQQEMCATIIRCILARQIDQDKHTTQSREYEVHEQVLNDLKYLKKSVCNGPINFEKLHFFSTNNRWDSAPIFRSMPKDERFLSVAYDVGCLAGPQVRYYENMMRSKSTAKGKKSYKKKHYKKKKSAKKTKKRR